MNSYTFVLVTKSCEDALKAVKRAKDEDGNTLHDEGENVIFVNPYDKEL